MYFFNRELVITKCQKRKKLFKIIFLLLDIVTKCSITFFNYFDVLLNSIEAIITSAWNKHI